VTAARAVERAVPAATLALVAAAWVASVRQMQGMDMGAATMVGPFSFFLGVWTLMMVAMMLPGAVPAIVARAQADGFVTVLRFAGSYLATWTLVGLVVYVAYRPHGDSAAAAVTIAAAVYELTPLKRECRRRCRARVRSGFQFGVYCVGSSIGLMATLAAIGLMSVTWSAVVAVVISAQKLVPAKALVDIALALGILALGIAIAL
jgi:predicted metal-binding membrane protein